VDIILSVKSKADESVQSIRHPVNGRLVLGRGPDSAVPLDAPGISREHLEVQAENSALFLTDLSSNGTWVNGARIPPRRKCKVGEGDFIELPGYEIRFQLVGAAAAPLVSLKPGLRPSSFARSFTGLELFLLVVVLASAALLVTYLTS
jgi:pSer/pThr/pTyr-binding forkhead associated (FHA) protein